MRKRLPFILLMMCVVVITSFCILYLNGDAVGEVKANVTDAKPRLSSDSASAMRAYEYNPRGRRDPFATLIIRADTEKKKGATPLENYETAEFKLTAILWNKKGYYAVITSPDNKSFTVMEGVKLGLRGGKVYKITKDSVIIRENVRDYRGIIGPKDTILKLRREEEG